MARIAGPINQLEINTCIRNRKITIDGKYWEPVMICPDSDELAAKGERAMVRFSRDAEPEFFTAPANTTHAGWVVGVPL